MDIKLVIVVLIVVGLLIAYIGKQAKRAEVAKSFTYSKNEFLLTIAERSFYGVLIQTVSEDFMVFAKVRVADVLNPVINRNKSAWRSAFNKISSKHFDYVLCQKDTLNIVAAIELDDKSHNSSKAKLRDAFLEDACRGADLKLIRFKAKSGYQLDSVKEHIYNSLNPER